MIFQSFALLTIIACISKSSYAEQAPSSDDIEEFSEIIVSHLAPLLESNGYTLEDLPNHLKYLTAKYCLIFFQGEEPLDILQKMISDYEIIADSQQRIAELFIVLNSSNERKLRDEYATNILDILNFRLQVVSRNDAVQFLLYQEMYPEIMDLISLMVTTHIYHIYLDSWEDDEGQLNHNNYDDSVSEDDFDLTEMVRKVYASSHGRLEYVLLALDRYIPAFNQESLTESTVDELDELHDYLEVKINRLWNFIKGSSYATTTDEWITRLEDMLRHFLTIVPLQEILDFSDALAINSNDRLALIIYRYKRRQLLTENGFDRDSRSVTNVEDIFDIIQKAVFYAVNYIEELLHDTVEGDAFEVSEEVFLEYMDELLGPYGMSTNDLSTDTRSIISRTFTRINSVQREFLSDTEEKVLKLHTQLFRQNLEKLRDAINILIPQESESHHIVLETLLQTVVNKYGALALQMRAILPDIFNNRFEYIDEKKIFEEDIGAFARKLDKIAFVFEESGIKPSEVLTNRLLEVVELIDGFVMFASF